MRANGPVERRRTRSDVAERLEVAGLLVPPAGRTGIVLEHRDRRGVIHKVGATQNGSGSGVDNGRVPRSGTCSVGDAPRQPCSASVEEDKVRAITGGETRRTAGARRLRNNLRVSPAAD